MPVQVSEDAAQAEGPNASLDFGQAIKEKELQRESGMLALGQQGQQQSVPPQQAQQPQQPPGHSGAPTIAQQPPPPSMSTRPPGTRFNAAGAFDKPLLQATPGWRERLAVWANHPDAGPYLKMLASLANADNTQPPADAQQPVSQRGR